VVLEAGERLEADQIIVCTGPESRSLLAPLGLKVPIMPVRGHSLTLPQGSEPPRVSITDTSRKLVFCSLSGRIRLAGQADVGASSARPFAKRLATLLDAARQSLPHAADYDHPLSSWAGLRPVTPNSLPIISRHGAITLNLGHGALGWTYAMGAAEEAARLVAGE
jgi:D-amino-acid dehydrogenase